MRLFCFQIRSMTNDFLFKKIVIGWILCMNVQIHKDTWILDLQNSKMQAMPGIQFIFHFEREPFKLEATKNPHTRTQGSKFQQKIRSSSHERRSRWNAINGWTEHACYTHVDILIQFGTVWNVILKDIQQAVVWIARIYSKSMCVFFNSLTKLW